MSADGAFRWHATGVAGSRDVIVRVTDPKGSFAEQSFSITVLELSNAAPAISPVPNVAGDEGQTLSVQLTASRSENHTSELQSLMPTSHAVFRLKKKKQTSST